MFFCFHDFVFVSLPFLIENAGVYKGALCIMVFVEYHELVDIVDNVDITELCIKSLESSKPTVNRRASQFHYRFNNTAYNRHHIKSNNILD